jgi:hypothetical protein
MQRYVAAKVFVHLRFSCVRKFGLYDQARTVLEQFTIKAGQLCPTLHSATEQGRSNKSSRIRGRGCTKSVSIERRLHYRGTGVRS